MTKDEALKMAIKEMTDAIPHLDIHFDDYFEAIQACKEALEQPTNMVTIPLDKLKSLKEIVSYHKTHCQEVDEFITQLQLDNTKLKARLTEFEKAMIPNNKAMQQSQNNPIFLAQGCKLVAGHEGVFGEDKVPAEALEQPTRLEVIDANGRTYTNWKVKELQFSYQDNGKTLKIFVTEVQND